MFTFKRFSVRQGGAAMKVGTDGVLLGAWCSVQPELRRALDIGTGTGVIALMLAQRGDAYGLEVDAVEIDPDAARQAGENFAASPWTGNLYIYNAPVQEFAKESAGKYDLIVSNPPYFIDSLLPPDAGRAAARHTGCLTHTELIAAVSIMLAPGGTASFVLPYEQAAPFISLAAGESLYPVRRTDVQTTPRVAPKRVLLEFSDRPAGEIPVDTLVIEYGGKDTFTEEYRNLTGEFYLKF